MSSVAAIKQTDESRRIEFSRDRYGYRIDGQFYRRVTTHLGGIPKQWLGNWAAKYVAEYAVENRESWEKLPATDAVKLLKGSPWSKRDDAADRGSAVHAVIENLVRGIPLPDMNEDQLECAAQAEAFLVRFGIKPLGTEITVFSPRWGHAGTLDYWGKLAPDFWLLDWKTSGDIYDEHAVQQVSYLNAEYAVVNKEPLVGKKEHWTGRVIPWGPQRANRLGVVHVRPDGAELHEVEPDQFERLWHVFRAAKFMKEWQSETESYYREPKVRIYRDPAYALEEAEK